ncbi:hypothetical protein [Novilysobacter erysipheiresistens]|uniref:Uncharacterized protein n=1 Tax=Novilysobacter erysipheiresistens TaxID=1749332 RepID=A0ABU7YY95_9GAMM
MNAYSTAANRNPSAVANATARQYVSATSPSRPPHRQRDFGVGYGTSSGYASNRSYVSRNVTPLFRCV